MTFFFPLRQMATWLMLMLVPALGVQPGMAGNLLVNGSFESGPPVPPSPGYSTLLVGSTSLLGWTVTGVSIDYVGQIWQHAEGTRSLDLDGSPGPGGVRQTFESTPGQWYAVDFKMAGNMVGGPTIKPLRVSAAGQSGHFTFDVTGHSYASMGWESRHWCFKAMSTSTTIEFLSTTPQGSVGGAALDDVVVEPSDPATPGDLNCDGSVNGLDLAILLGQWTGSVSYSSCPPHLPADLNVDCKINGLDLAMLLGAWS